MTLKVKFALKKETEKIEGSFMCRDFMMSSRTFFVAVAVTAITGTDGKSSDLMRPNCWYSGRKSAFVATINNVICTFQYKIQHYPREHKEGCETLSHTWKEGSVCQ